MVRSGSMLIVIVVFYRIIHLLTIGRKGAKYLPSPVSYSKIKPLIPCCEDRQAVKKGAVKNNENPCGTV